MDQGHGVRAEKSRDTCQRVRSIAVGVLREDVDDDAFEDERVDLNAQLSGEAVKVCGFAFLGFASLWCGGWWKEVDRSGMRGWWAGHQRSKLLRHYCWCVSGCLAQSEVSLGMVCRMASMSTTTKT